MAFRSLHPAALAGAGSEAITITWYDTSCGGPRPPFAGSPEVVDEEGPDAGDGGAGAQGGPHVGGGWPGHRPLDQRRAGRPPLAAEGAGPLRRVAHPPQGEVGEAA